MEVWKEFPKVVFTLVHGTWGRRAKWLEPGSLLRMWLQKSFLDLEAVVPFYWSGRNSYSARNEAAADLQRVLQENLERYPQAKHFIIAHSHGGNIAMYALRNAYLRHHISGLVCLSTPFLHPQKYVLGPLIYRYLTVALFLLVSLPGGFVMHGLHAPTLGWGLMFASASVVGTVLGHLVLTPWQRYASKVERDLELPSLDKNQLLIIRSLGDSASGFLGAAQFLNWLISRAWMLLTFWAHDLLPFLLKVLELPEKWLSPKTRTKKVAAAAMALSLIAGLAVQYKAPGWQIAAGILILLAFALILNVLVLMLCCTAAVGYFLLFCSLAVLLFPLIVIQIMLMLPFGLEPALSSVWFGIVPESTPAGESTLHQLDIFPFTLNESDSWQISKVHATYEDHRSLEIMKKWIYQTMGRGLIINPGKD